MPGQGSSHEQQQRHALAGTGRLRREERMTGKRAVIVLSHGTRHQPARQDFQDFILALRRRLPGYRIEPAFKEMAAPSLAAVVETLYSEQVRTIAIIPFFLFNGRHLTEDMPRIVAALQNKYEQLTVTIARPLMPEARFYDIMTERIQELWV